MTTVSCCSRTWRRSRRKSPSDREAEELGDLLVGRGVDDEVEKRRRSPEGLDRFADEAFGPVVLIEVVLADLEAVRLVGEAW